MSSNSLLDSLLNSSTNSSSTNPIDISSILSATSGNAAAIDVNTAVAAAIYADRAPERVWQADQTTLSNESSALTQIENATTSVANDLQSLNTLDGPLAARTVTSSGSDVTATAAAGTAAGTHTVTVNSLATTGSWYSALESSATSALPTSSFTIKTASGASQTFSTGSGTSGDNLNDLASAINAASLGVTASVVTDADGARISVVANSSGAAADFSVTSGSGFSFTQATAGANASLTIDGVPVSSASNTVTGAIAGVTLNLQGASQTQETLTVASDANQVSDAINQFVTDYNTLVGLVNTQFTADSNGNEGPLGSDSTIVNLQSALQQALNYAATPASGSTTTVSNLNDLGITQNNDGTLSVDTTTLDSALINNPNGVQNFFEGSALNGFANSFGTTLNTFTDPAQGAFTLDLQGISAQNTDLTNEINDFETNYIANQQTVLTAAYSNAEEALQALPTEEKQIQAELGNNGSGSSS